MGSESLEYYKNDQAGAAAKRTEAQEHAEETLALAAERTGDPTYSTAVMTAHQTLAAVVLRDGDRKRAVRHMQESVKVPPSEELSHAPPHSWLKPVNYLLDAGERDRVVGFLEASARLTVRDRDQLLSDAQAIREGWMTSSLQVTAAHEKAPPYPCGRR